jgi:hypothetical protein
VKTRLTLVAASIVVFCVLAANNRPQAKATDPSSASLTMAAAGQNGGPLVVTVKPWGPDQATIDRARADLLKNPSILAALRGAQYRLLFFDLIQGEKVNGSIQPPDRYRATIYDYTANRAIIAEAKFGDPQVKITESENQPLPSNEELDAAIEIVTNSPEFGSAIRSNALQPYPPMPPVSVSPAVKGGKPERIVHVGLLPVDASHRHEIVGVNMTQSKVIRWATGAPDQSAVRAAVCGLPSAGQSTTSRGTAGSATVTVTQGGVQLWNMVVIRPSVSSGTRGSAIELLNVNYRGKRVLTQAHAPILNVQYEGNLCGPFRDWQYQEGSFIATGTDQAPGIRMCTAKPETILENNSDTGNFRGVGVFIEDGSLLLLTELQAGWYRYISRWEFSADGTIRPRFGFGGVSNSCVCNAHNHHVYWRLDFDVAGTSNTIWEGFLRGFRKPLLTEARRHRGIDGAQKMFIMNSGTGEIYALTPGPDDNVADSYSRADTWFLARRSTELDDGHDSTGSNTEADLDQFLTSESVKAADIVIWYAGHFLHQDGHEGIHIVGPDISPIFW